MVCKHSSLRPLTRLLVIVALFFVSYSCKHHRIKIDPGFSEYISAFTSGTISVKSDIRIELAKPVESVQVNSEIEDNLLSFSPRVSGKTYWIDNHTIEFKPEKPLNPSTIYECSFNLSKIIKNLPDKYKKFNFEFKTIKQALTFELNGYQPYVMTSLTWNYISGVVRTADATNDHELENIFKATQENKNLFISWIHDDNSNEHKFKIDSVYRSVNRSKVLVKWNGSPISVESAGEDSVKIPSLNDFSAVEAKIIQSTQQYISVKFSDPLDVNQDLTGLIVLDNSVYCSYEIDGMNVKVYPSVNQFGTVNVSIQPGIKNVAGAKLSNKQTFQLSFENIKPSIKIIGKGTIIPDSKRLILPFSSVNIKAVDVRIIKIFENNISQFLQVNKIDGGSELYRAGRLILKKTIHLDSEKHVDFSHWNNFSVDLSDLIKQEPGAIYRVELSFSKKYSVYPCNEQTNDDPKENMSTVEEDGSNLSEGDVNYWDSPSSNYYENDYNEYGYNYNWNERENPCKQSYYYGENCKVTRNVFASNLGIIAKKGANQTITVAVANLLTTKPIKGVNIEAFDFQHQKIGSGTTDKDGISTINLSGIAFLLIAKDGNQHGYLRVDDGNALSLSNFDVSGEAIQKGLKGYIYGERGVWRPGDTVYLTFILEDKLKSLPANHPVVLELFNPKGQLYKRIVKTSGVNGFYQYNIGTSDNDPTGNWLANIKIGGTTFSKTLKIESIKPNRLKIQFDFKTSLLKGNEHANLNVKWLNGAIAKNMKASVSVTLSPIKTSFKGFDGYEFDDPIKKFQVQDKEVFQGSLNESGNTDVKANILTEQNSPGFLQANFVTRVFEPGGDFSIDRFSLLYSPYDSYVGVKPPKDEWGFLYTDTNQVFEIVTLSAEGKPVSRNNLEFKIFKLEWRWWWDSGNDEMANFENNTYTKPVFSKSISTLNGKTNVKYKIDYPNWGRFLVRVTDPVSGHSTGKIVYFDWPGWRGRADRGDAKGASMLMFNSDKKSYVVGEKATITVPSSEGGRMLVSLESGSQVLRTFWVETQKKETKATFDITDKMTPNIYVHVSLIQPHAQTSNDLPLRMYGIIPILVENPGSHLYPIISMPDVMEPEKPVNIVVSEKNSHPMTYTLAVVDDGLLDLTRFKTPDPWTSFYGREALGVNTWDLYDDVLGAYGGKIESLFAIGGDGDLKGGAGKKANRFKAIVKVLGPFSLKSGSNTHIITLPQYIGSVRVMVVAGDNDAFGKAEKSVPVRKPLMTLATLPRVLGPGEEVSLPVTIFAMDKKIKNFTVEVLPNELFQVVGQTSKAVPVNEIGEYDLTFQLKVASREGVGKVKVIARNGKDISQYDIEVNVRNPNSKITKYYETTVEAGKSAEINYSLIGIIGTNQAKLEVSSMPPIDLSRRLDYLITYPYGCVEQTTSSAFPQLYLDNLVQLTPEVKKYRDENVKRAIQRLNTMLIAGGGFGYWPGDNMANEWGTSYAGHFLLEAELKGYNVPPDFKRNWLGYQRKMANNWQLTSNLKYYSVEDEELTQAYRLYTLALAKQPEMGAMNRMKEIPNLSYSASLRLAATYALAGQMEVARDIVSRAKPASYKYYWFSSTFGSDERDIAMMLETLSLIGNKKDAFITMKKVSEFLSGDRWLSTQSTAYSLLAISKFMLNEKVTGDVHCTYSNSINSGINIDSHMPIVQATLGNKKAGNDKVIINNTGKGLLFARVITMGIPETGPAEPFENKLKISLSYKNSSGESIDITKLQQGTDFVVDVSIKNMFNSNVSYLALDQVFPSGWEIGNDRLDKEGVSTENSSITYQDIRDDRVYTFFNLINDGTATFRIRLTATYAGRFYLPGTLCEAMYEHGVNAFLPGKWIEVVK